MKHKTVQPRSAADLSAEIKAAAESWHIPIIVADQPSLAAIVAKESGLSANSKTDDASVMRALKMATDDLKSSKKVTAAVIVKASKDGGAGSMSGRYFVKVMSSRIYISVGSVADFLMGE